MRSGVGYRMGHFTSPWIRWASDTLALSCKSPSPQSSAQSNPHLTRKCFLFLLLFPQLKCSVWIIFCSFFNAERTMTPNGDDALCLRLTGGQQSGRGRDGKFWKIYWFDQERFTWWWSTLSTVSGVRLGLEAGGGQVPLCCLWREGCVSRASCRSRM